MGDRLKLPRRKCGQGFTLIEMLVVVLLIAITATLVVVNLQPDPDKQAHLEAERFAALFSGQAQRASAAAMDSVLHAERLAGKARRTHRRAIDTLPDGAMIARDGEAFAVRGPELLPWTPAGYAQAMPRPHAVAVDVLTPPGILAVLVAGYAPLWHVSVAASAF